MLSGPVCQGELVNNSSSTLRRLSALYVDAELSDVTLVVGGQHFHAHRLILSMSSDVLKTMLSTGRWAEARRGAVELCEEGGCVAVFADFLRYMYTGRIVLAASSVLSILTLADKYNVRDLSHTCVQFMCHNCDAGAESSVVSWLQYARLCSYKTLERYCLSYIEWNFQKVLCGPDFLSMRQETLLAFLHSSCLVVVDEYSLFVGVKRWLMHQRSNCFMSHSCFETLVKKVLANIRFSKFKQNQLEQLIHDPLIVEFPSVLTGQLSYTPDDCSCKPVFSVYHKCAPTDKTDCQPTPVLDLPAVDTCHTESTNSVEACPRVVAGPGVEFCPEVETGQGVDLCSMVVASPGVECLPRNYLCEDWSTQLFVNYFSSFTPHGCRTLFFSTPCSAERDGLADDSDDQRSWDWQVDLYPKGIFFPPGVLIGLHENYLIDQQEHQTVRISVLAKCFRGNRHVEITVLAIARGQDEGSEYVKNVVSKKCIFDSDGCLYNVDNVVPFNELQDTSSSYLTGEDRDTFKIVIIIKPTAKSCSRYGY